MIKLLIGGSPCTYWGIAQTKNRETKPSGLGWELFENYLIAKEKFKPDFYLYENNVSAAAEIKNEIKKRFGVGETDARYIEINSALVSAQNRQRFYVHNCGEVEQPEDRGVLLQDIIETGATWAEKSYALTTRCVGAIPEDTLKRRRHTMVAEPVRIGTIENAAKGNHDSKQYRVYSPDGKSTTLCGQGGGVGAKTGLYACPVTVKKDGKKYNIYEVRNGFISIKGNQYPIKLADGFYIIRKLTVTECCRLQTMPDDYCRARIEKVKEIVLKCKDVPARVVTIPLQTEKQGCAINTTFDLKEMEVQNLKDQNLTHPCLALSMDVIDVDKHTWDIVLCTIKDLKETEPQDWLEAIMSMCKVTMNADLSIEKLPKECLDENLKKEKSYITLTLIQKIIAKIISMFVPQKNMYVCIENYAENCLSTSPTSLTVGTSYSTEKNMKLVSESACYRGLGNGWTAEVIIHILNGALKDVPRDTPIQVLSMYDGIGTGRYCLDKMGFTNVEYHAYEIDKYAIQVAKSNYSDIIEHGDAYAVRESGNFNF